MNGELLLESALKIGMAHGYALFAHRGQTDKAGCPYIEHPRRVADKLVDPEDKIVALLHDVLEDSDATYPELVEIFGVEVAMTVSLLTRTANMSYSEYIDNICASGNMRAIRVKLADVLDNSDPNRLQALAEIDFPTTVYLRGKYARSREKLESRALGVTVTGS